MMQCYRGLMAYACSSSVYMYILGPYNRFFFNNTESGYIKICTDVGAFLCMLTIFQ